MCTSGEEVFYLVVGVFCHFKTRLLKRGYTYKGWTTETTVRQNSVCFLILRNCNFVLFFFAKS